MQKGAKAKAKTNEDEDDLSGVVPHKQAAVAGIQAHGLKWDNALRIGGTKAFTAIIGQYEADDLEDPSNLKQLSAATHNFAKKIKSWLASLRDRTEGNEKIANLVDDFEHRHEEDLDFLSDDDFTFYEDKSELLDEIRGRLNALYDSFDYYRVLVS